jgi:uncharacterized integral membrane protein
MNARIISAVFFLFFVAVAVIFTAWNPGRVDIELGFSSVNAPLSLALVAALALGWLLGLASAGAWMFKRRRALKRKEKAERAAAQSRSLPAIDERG